MVISLVALLAPWIAPYGQSQGTLGDADLQPVWNGGTWDHMHGHRPAGLRHAVAADLRCAHLARHRCVVVVLAGLVGVLIGLIAGYKGGRTDRLLMGWVDVQVSFPGLLMAAAADRCCAAA